VALLELDPWMMEFGPSQLNGKKAAELESEHPWIMIVLEYDFGARISTNCSQ